jgi:hypothetical protein
MNRQQRVKWERTRAQGMWRFALLWAVLGSGSMIFAKFVFYSNFGILAGGLIGLVVGFLTGLAIWLIGEYTYQKNFDND